jgi:anti-sigma factor RsiW
MAAPDEMSCKELVEVVTDYLEGVLSPRDRARFEEHLGQCPGCQTYLDQMRQTIHTLGRLKEESVPAAAWEALQEAFRGWKRTR